MKKYFALILIGVIMMGLFTPNKAAAAPGAETLVLPAPERQGGMPLMEALDKRMSSRSFTQEELPEQVLSNLLWAAWGYNRADQKKRTAPSSMNKQELSVYAALKSGLYLYDAEAHALQLVSGEDIRSKTGSQPFVNSAPLNLIFVADSKKQNSLTSSYANAGFISQNVYLFCASEGLGTVVRGWFNEKSLHQAMGLGKDRKIILCQTVGYPK
ncbi:MAG: SagB/ThcOx family dehydrogenase [Candidatus Marinimicrobia bacterium]|nr:SagB/ThcOx family dehydrogenase [Candidatus Neomarinimicrobiota bacterium]